MDVNFEDEITLINSDYRISTQRGCQHLFYSSFRDKSGNNQVSLKEVSQYVDPVSAEDFEKIQKNIIVLIQFCRAIGYHNTADSLESYAVDYKLLPTFNE